MSTIVRFLRPDGFTTLLRTVLNSDTDGIRSLIASLVGNTREVRQLPDGTWPPAPERRAWLSYRWVATYAPQMLPTEQDGARPGDEFVGPTAVFLPGQVAAPAETRTAVLAEDFTHVADGSPWPSRWVKGRVPATGGSRVENERGILTSGMEGGWATGSHVSMVVAGWREQDAEILFDFTLPTHAAAEIRVYGRSDNADLNMATGVWFTFSRTRVQAGSASQWTYPVAGQTNKALDGGVTYRARVVCAQQASSGARLRARVWIAGADEPSAWDVDAVASAVVTEGAWGFYHPGTSEAVTADVAVDRVRVYDRPPTADPGRWGVWAG